MKSVLRQICGLAAGLSLAAVAPFVSPATASESSDSLLIENFPVGALPGALAFDGTNIWTTALSDGYLIKVRASDGAILGKYGIFEPLFVASDGPNVWVTNGVGDVTKFRGTDGAIEKTIDLGTSQLGGIISDGTSIWVAVYAGNTVYKLRPSDGEILGVYSVGPQPNQLAFDGANVWVTNSYGDSVSKLRASDGHLLFTAPAGDSPFGIVFDGHDIWVANSYPGGVKPAETITKLRLSDGAIIGTAKVGRNPQLLAFDGHNVWVSNYYPDNTVLQVSDRDGSRKRTFAEGIDPDAILFDGTSIWISYPGSGTLCKITPSAP
jgi:hypothetical protein